MVAETLVAARPAPELNIPSGATVNVKVIDSTSTITLNQSLLIEPKLLEDDEINIPSYSFLISHGNEHILFDLGVRKDPENFPPAQVKRISKMKMSANVQKNVSEILDDHASSTGIASKDVAAIVWSHRHWDHIGDVSTFPKSIPIVVGPGFKNAHLPGYPDNPESGLYQSDFEGRVLREVDIEKEGKGLTIGRLYAYDYFGDGSFFLLDTPGHDVGHVCGLARVTSSPDSFILMGGDASHNIGEMRPSEYLPLPKHIHPSPVARFTKGGCPGEWVESLHEDTGATKSIYKPRKGFNHDDDEAQETIYKLNELDASPGVLVVLAHDEALQSDLPYFPTSINDWFEKDLDARTRWQFLKPLGEVIESAAARAKLT